MFQRCDSYKKGTCSLIFLTSLILLSNHATTGFGEADIQNLPTSSGSCGLITDTLVDYLLARFLANETVRTIPNQKTNILEFRNGKIYGLNTLHRTCPIHVTQSTDDEGGTILSVNVCVKARRLQITAGLLIRTIIGVKIPQGLDVKVEGLAFRVGIKVNLKKGGSLDLTEFEITELGSLTLDNDGLAGVFDGFLNWIVNSKAKKLIVNMIQNGVNSAVKSALKEVKL